MALIEMTFASDTLQRWTEVTVILPMEKAGNPDSIKPELFPSLYLLHGYSGNTKDWLTYSNIRLLAEQYNLAVIMPSGENGFYVDNEATELRNGQFMKELVEYTRKIFPLSPDRDQTFIGGLSMGGFGALRNGMKYSELFGKIFSLSGAFILDDIAGKKEGYRDAMAGYGYYSRIFGNLDIVKDTEKNPVICAKAAIEKGIVPEIFMACGTEDFLRNNNRQMKKFLQNLGLIPLYYEDTGSHDWTFWNTWMPKALEWIMKDERQDIK